MTAPSPEAWAVEQAKERFEARYIPEPNSGCWLWMGPPNDKKGYCVFWFERKLYLAHRFAYEFFVGPIPNGLTLDHLCRTTCCVNPRHLEPVTNRENILRGTAPSAMNGRKTHCRRGHPFDEANTRHRVSGARVCGACRNAYDRARWVPRSILAAARAPEKEKSHD